MPSTSAPHLPNKRSMASPLRGLAPRVILVALVILLATGTLTYAASQELTTPAASPATATPATASLVVPDVRGQAYVFAKGMLEDAGFAWELGAGSEGSAGYRVVAQSPKQGTRVVNTGAPTVVLRVVAAKEYAASKHTPDQSSPYGGTDVRLVGAPVHRAVAPKRAKVSPKAKAPAKKKVAATPVAKHPVAAKKVAAKPDRAPAFTVADAPHEPLDE